MRRRDVGHRIQLLDDVPSPYLSGLLPSRPSPIFYETNRGCPYRCAFCYWGNGNAKVYRMSLERVRAEMELFARSGVSSFWIADANFGIFPSDAEIAETMAEINGRFGRPFKPRRRQLGQAVQRPRPRHREDLPLRRDGAAPPRSHCSR